MKGLVIKDFYCLKKELLLFIGTTISTMVLSVLFILSLKCGNLADAMVEVQVTDKIGAEMLISLMNLLMLLTSFLPLALIGSITECFRSDGKADFSKVLFSMPVSCEIIVGSRYVACMLFSTACMAASMACGIVISWASDSIRFENVWKGTICVWAFFLIYMSLEICLLYLWGIKKSDYIQTIPVIAAMIASMIQFASKVSDASDEEMSKIMLETIERGKDFLMENVLLFLGIAVSCMILSYFFSVIIVKKKKERI